MFNSKKKQAAAEAEQSQRAHIDALRAQLDEVRDERVALEARIATLGKTNEQLDLRLRSLDQGVVGVGEQLVALGSSNAETNRRVQAIDERLQLADTKAVAIDQRLDRFETLSSEIDAINVRLQSFDASAALASTTPPPPPLPTTSVPTPDGAEASDRVDELRATLAEIAQQTSSIDARVTSVSMELANQLTELSSDIDELNRRNLDPLDSNSAAAIDAAALEARLTERLDVAIDDVLDSTERLAAEQARYEIRFRADLAELAERVRRPGTA